MILPIIAYGSSALRKETENIDSNYPDLSNLVANLFETMYNAKGVGLAAPQIGLPIAVFVIDSEKMEEENSNATPIKKVFINPEIIESFGENTTYSEGCLSVPGINEDVVRKESIKIWYQDEHFAEHEAVFTGNPARIIQHEYDHLLGKTFVDRLSSLKRTLLRGKLRDISTGRAEVAYKMKVNGL
jgi:peptide deformylase